MRRAGGPSVHARRTVGTHGRPVVVGLSTNPESPARPLNALNPEEANLMTRQHATSQPVTLQDAAERTADPQEPCRSRTDCSRTNVSLSDMEVVIHNLMC